MAFKDFDKNSLEELFAKLSWILLEQKCLYYTLTHSKYEPLRISDKKYDMIERAYVKIGSYLKKSVHIHEMVGFSKTSHPATALVYKKIKEKKKAIPVENSLMKFVKEILVMA